MNKPSQKVLLIAAALLMRMLALWYSTLSDQTEAEKEISNDFSEMYDLRSIRYVENAKEVEDISTNGTKGARSWHSTWLRYAKSHDCFTENYTTMDDEFAFYTEILRSEPNLLEKMDKAYQKSMFLQQHVFKISIKEGKLASADCLRCAWVENFLVRDHLSELSEIFSHFKNLTFYFSHGDFPKTAFKHSKPGNTDVTPLTASLIDLKSQCPPDVYSNFGKHNLKRIRTPCFLQYPTPLPFFSSTKLPKGCNGDLLAPNIIFDLRREACALVVPWRNKKIELYWRGSDTGGGPYGFRKAIMDSLYRMNLSSDLAFHALPECHAACTADMDCSKAAVEVGVKNGIDLCMHQKYRYLPDIDGNTYSRRFPSLGTQNSVIIRFSGAFSSWYHDFLKPGEHYIDVPTDLFDNPAKILELLPGDKKEREMARKMTQVSRKLMNNGAKCYWFRLLLGYSEIFGFS